MSRIPILKHSELTAEQRRVYDAIEASRDGTVLEVFMAMMHSPELTGRTQRLGEYLRYLNGLGLRLSELAILTTARHWNCQYAWHYHEIDARKGGLADAVIEAIRERRQPQFENADEAAVYAFCHELQSERRVSDATYQAALDVLGATGIVELTALTGYYAMMAMSLNSHQVPLPPGAEPGLPV